MRVRTVVLGTLAACTAVAAQPADRWVEARTERFRIVSNAGDRDVRRTAIQLSQFLAVASRLLGVPAGSEIPITVLAFRDDTSFRPFKPRYNGQPANISGFFQRTGDDTIVALDINAPRDQHPFAVLFHEYTHLLTSDSTRDWPAWVFEGVAEFYSTLDADGEHVTVGRPIADHVRLLRGGPIMPLAELFAISRDSGAYNEGQRQSLFYAQSWALVHYLMVGNEARRRPAFEQFLASPGSGRDPAASFRDSLGAGESTLETELRGYLSRRVFPVVTYRLDSPVAVGSMEVRPLSAVERELQLGHLLAQTDRLAEAETFFNRARALDRDAPEPYEQLAFLALQRAQPAQAIDLFGEAISRQSRNFRVHYQYADALHRQQGAGQMDLETAEVILRAAETAAQLASWFLPAHHLIGRVSLGLPANAEAADGIRRLVHARSIFPDDAALALMLASLQARAGDYPSAKSNAIFVTTSPAAEESLKAQARRLLIQVEEAVMLQSIRADPGVRSGPAPLP